MARAFESNPFDDGGPGHQMGTGFSGLDDVPLPRGDDVGIAMGAVGGGLSTKDIKQKEKELKKKERELALREEALTRGELKVRNYPPCYPIVHHDIMGDIPENGRHIQFAAFFSWWGLVICLLYNLVAVGSALVTKARGDNGVGFWFVALIVTLFAIPLSWWLWYKRLYAAMAKESTFSFLFFFMRYILHIVFCTFVAIAPPVGFKNPTTSTKLFTGYSFAGLFTTLDLFSHHHVVSGIFYLVGFVMWSLETLLSLYVMTRVWAYFRKRGNN